MFVAEVTERCQDFGDATYAATNAVSIATSEQDFVKRVFAALEAIGLRCIENEDVERYEHRIAAFQVDRSITQAAERAGLGAVEFGTFHVTDEPSAE